MKGWEGWVAKEGEREKGGRRVDKSRVQSWDKATEPQWGPKTVGYPGSFEGARQ